MPPLKMAANCIFCKIIKGKRLPSQAKNPDLMRTQVISLP